MSPSEADSASVPSEEFSVPSPSPADSLIMAPPGVVGDATSGQLPNSQHQDYNNDEWDTDQSKHTDDGDTDPSLPVQLGADARVQSDTEPWLPEYVVRSGLRSGSRPGNFVVVPVPTGYACIF